MSRFSDSMMRVHDCKTEKEASVSTVTQQHLEGSQLHIGRIGVDREMVAETVNVNRCRYLQR